MSRHNADLKPAREGKKWTEEEDAFLEAYYATHNTEEMAKAIERSPGAVRARAKKKNLKKIFNNQIIDGKKTCSVCGRLLPIEEFNRSNKPSSGYESGCRVCYSDRQKAARKLERIKEATAKENYTCSKCGQTKPGWQFKWSSIKKKRETICQECCTERDRRTKIQRIKDGRDW